MKIYKKILIVFLFFLAFDAFSQNRTNDALGEYRSGNFERAIQICRDEINDNPNNLDSHVVMCWALLRLNRYEEALRFARAGRNINRFDVRIIEILGEIHYYQGLNNEALQYFQEYISLVPEGQRVEMIYYFMGEIYIRQGKFRHADIALSTAVHWVPGNAAWWVRLAYARENTGDLGSALEAYERALSLNSQLADAQRGLDRIRQTMGGTQGSSIQTSTVISPAPPPTPAPVVRPGLTGNVTINNTTPRAGDAVIASYTGNGTGTASWQWLANNIAIGGATSNTFVVGVPEVGRTLSARVSYVNQSGSITSAPTMTVTMTSLTGNVSINNASPRAGDTIVAYYTGSGNGMASWQWLADDNVINGAINNTYVVNVAEIGRTLRARVSYSNQSGSITSTPTTAVARANLTGIITINIISPKVGDVVTASYTGNGTGVVTWQWLSNNSVIRGATNSTYVIGPSDVGRTLRARVTFADQNNSITSAATNAVTRR